MVGLFKGKSDSISSFRGKKEYKILLYALLSEIVACFFFIKSVDVCHFHDLPCFSFVLIDFILFFNFENYVSLISAALCGTSKDIRV